MDLSFKWLKSYIDIDVSPREFSHRMTMTGSKVEGWSSEADGLNNVVTGRVLSLERHPDSDHLWICKADIGKRGQLQIVTGAQNLKQGDVVPVALDNSDLPNGTHIASGKLRGEISEGMFCSLGELGLTVHDYPECIENGIMVLPENTPLGEDIAKILGMDDLVFEFEITSNRPDCLSIDGLAREAAITFDLPEKKRKPSDYKTHGDISPMLTVENDTPDTCSRYIGAVVENVRVKPSPEWLRERLRHSGVRPINNIVDITNYVMLEMGQPMHAFDLRNVHNGKIIVRRAQANESIETLDGVQRKLNPSMTIIADAEKPIAIAGIMGGEFSSITDDTSSIVFESACFNGVNVRMTAKSLGMRTESSARFEKGLDPNNTLSAIKRALELVALLDAGDIVGGFCEAVGNVPKPPHIPLQPERINSFLGTDISTDFMVKTLRALECSVDDNLVVTPPSFRADLEGFADLAEEIARFYGYDVIPTTVMSGIVSARPTKRQRLEREIANTCVGCGLYEINTYSFMSAKSFDLIALPADAAQRRAVVISNPFGEDTSLLRSTALPSMLETLARNYNARVPSARLFEIAVEFTPNDDLNTLPFERKKLIVGGYAAGFDFYVLKGVVEAILASCGIKGAEFHPETTLASYHPGRSASVWVSGKEIGHIGEILPTICSNYGIKERVYACELPIDTLFELSVEAVHYRPLPRFPALSRDLALLCDEDIPSAAIEAIIRENCGELLEKVSVFDVYTGDKIPSGKKSIAYSLVLRDLFKTLTDADADKATAKVLEALAKIGIELRH
ncbi:MAG: phenylalanine--tRNA ligase subunit beta [Oscillospiraceae bacterium]